MKKLASIMMILFLTASASGCSIKKDDDIILAGSTSVQPYAEILEEHYHTIHPDSVIDIQGGGSSAGITATLSGTADVGMSSRALKEKDGELWSVEIAKDGLAIIIHPRNPIENLTKQQLQDIYSGKITNWNEIGGVDRKIHLINREEGSGTRSAFEDLAMDEVPTTLKAIVQDSNGAVKQIVCQNENAIGFISLGLVDDTVKNVSINGIAPTHDNVVKDVYKLYRPFLFVASKEPEGPAKQFIDFVLSKEGQEILYKEGLITLGEV